MLRIDEKTFDEALIQTSEARVDAHQRHQFTC